MMFSHRPVALIVLIMVGLSSAVLLPNTGLTDQISSASSINRVRWSADGNYLAVSFDDGAINILSASTFQVLRTLNAGAFGSIAWGPVPYSNRLAGTDIDGHAWIWNVDTGKTLVSINSLDAIQGIAWKPDGTRIATGHIVSHGLIRESFVRIWDSSTGTLLSTFSDYPSALGVEDWSHDGVYISTVSDTEVVIWDTASGQPVSFLAGEDITTEEGDSYKQIGGGKWSPDGSLIATSGGFTIRTWDTGTYQPDKTFFEPAGIQDIVWHPTFQWFASAHTSGIVNVWDATSGQKVCRIENDHPVNSIDWSPDGKKLALGDSISGEASVIRFPGADCRFLSSNS